MEHFLTIDQGTSGTKCLILDKKGTLIARGYVETYSQYPEEGFVEQDPEEIYKSTLDAVQDCLHNFTKVGNLKDIVACGISNQRESFVVWDRSGKALHNAVIWQCKRSVGICEELKSKDLEQVFSEKTGLIIDPYFSGTKLSWLIRNNPKIQKEAQQKNAYFGTIDSWLLQKLTNGKEYRTDITNASRTLLFNIKTKEWDSELMELLGVTDFHFPKVDLSDTLFGETDFEGLLPNKVPIHAMIGDSHSAAFGERCFSAGTAKSTMGTGSSFLMNTGTEPVQSRNGMVTTICFSAAGVVHYALEGIIVSCGSPIKWLKDNLGLIADSSETEKLALEVQDTGGVHLIPSFSGLGAPYWKMDARGAITGLTFGSDRRHIVRAALDSITYQIKDIVTALEEDSDTKISEISFDGGITANNYVMQSIADILQISIKKISMEDVSAVGAALLAGLGCGSYKNLEEISKITFSEQVIAPSTVNDSEKIFANYQSWKKSVYKVL